MKNNKGFTLIEILASLVILGFVSALAIPKIFDYISSSRETLYIQDAKKMIAQAQYRMGASSTEIEKPSEGEVVVFTLNFLAGNDFKNAPNGGKYLFDASFVIVTYSTIDNQYHYAGMLVEKLNEKSMNGIKLSTEDLINTDSRTKLIEGFSSDEIVFPTKSINYKNTSTLLTSSYIKEKLAGETGWEAISEEGSIVRIYHDKNVEELETPR